MIVILPHYGSGTNDGTPESHARNYGNTVSLASKMNAKQAEIKAMQQKMDANQAKMDATLKEIKAGQDA
jgi:23S rRNA maturation-related 3'-5' exoribonuclease YhaM